jgi:hypothetical protein
MESKMKEVRKLAATVSLTLLAMVVLALLIGTASAQETPQAPDNSLGDHITRVNALFSEYDVAPPYGQVGKEEITLLQSYFGMTQGGANYIAWFDFNADGMIDINDIAQVASRVGCTFVDACYW